MNLELSLSLLTDLTAFTFALFAIEMLILSRNTLFKNVWSYNNLKSDLEKGMPFSRKLLQLIYSNTGFQILLWLQLACAVYGFFISSPIPFLILAITHLFVCVRFRGTFNGGSDMMGFVLLTGLLLALSTSNAKIQQLGLVYISIHAIYSYLKAGFVKIKNKDWQTGRALAEFLERSLFFEMKTVANWLRKKPKTALYLSWLVLAFELSLFVIVFFPSLALPYFIVATLFHFGNYVVFGLNRFFWTWLSSWTAILYAVSQLKR